MNFDISDINYSKFGEEMYKWARDLFPLNRSITGQSNRDTLKYLKNHIPELQIKSFKTGQQVFDWVVPQEWNVIDAYIEDENQNKIIDFKVNNLHLVGYSQPIDIWIDLNELKEHLFSLPELPDAIPYKTSYYKKNWGFCLTQKQLSSLENKKYHVYINTDFTDGEMNYGELVLKGKNDEEILLSTYICHPSMANNEISGIVVTAELAKILSNDTDRYYTYRILFIPETIGSIAYLSCNWEYMKAKTIAGFVVTCVGDNNNYSFLPSRLGNTLADRAAKYALENYVDQYSEFSFLDRGSDERQYCSPLIDLPVASIMRTKYGEYIEYHTSLDNLNFISVEGLLGSFSIIYKTLQIIENNRLYTPLIFCEPQLGKRGLYNITSNDKADTLINMLAYIDGKMDLIDIAKTIKSDFFTCAKIAETLLLNKLIK